MLFKCTKTAFIRNVVTVTVRFRVIQAQVRSRGLLQEFIDGGWFWRYFVIRVLEATLAWMWVWTAVWDCQFWHNGVPLVLCFPCQLVFITKCYVAFPCLTQRFMVSSAGKLLCCMACCVLHCFACHLKDCSQMQHVYLMQNKTNYRQIWLTHFFPFFSFLKKI